MGYMACNISVTHFINQTLKYNLNISGFAKNYTMLIELYDIVRVINV